MRAEWVNPFLTSLIDVWSREFGQPATKARLTSPDSSLLDGELSLVFDIQGPLNGVVIYEMETATAIKIVSAKTGDVVSQLDDLTLSPLKHVMSTIVRQAIFDLGQSGLKCRPTLPKMYQANGQRYALDQKPQQVGVVFGSAFGEIQARVGLSKAIKDTSNIDWLMSQSGMARK